MSDGQPIDGAAAAPASEPAAAQAQPAQAAAEAAKPAPRNLPYARPQRAAQAVAQPAASEAKPADDKPAGKPAANRAAAMQRARADKLASELEAARKTAGEVESMRKVLGGYAADAIKPLPKEWQDYLKELAGDDPAKLLDYVRKTEHLRTSAAPAAPVPPPKLPSTAPTGTPPAPNSADPDLATLATYEQLVRDNKRMAAARYSEEHGAAIARGRAKRGGNAAAN